MAKTTKSTGYSDGKSSQESKSPDSGEIMFKLPGGMQYRIPGKRQRVVIGSLVIGLNLLLVIAVVVYFYVPSFQTFVYNFGR